MPRASLPSAIATVGLALAACGGAVSSTGAHDGGAPDATSPATDAATSDAGDASCSQFTQPCDDGTGATDCCPASLIQGTACSCPLLTCWTQCMAWGADAGTFHSEVGCSGGVWRSGKGLFPCTIGDL